MKYIISILLFVCSFLLFSIITFADSANLSGYGNTVQVLDSDVIEMADEDIFIYVYPASSSETMIGSELADENVDRIEIDVSYTFKNTSDEEQWVLMGFPESCSTPEYSNCSSFPSDYFDSEYKDDYIDDFRLHEFKALETNGNALDPLFVTYLISEDETEPNFNWYTYNVYFAPNEEKIIKNTYWVTPSMYYTNGGANYILETGASWLNDINAVDIYAFFMDGISVYDVLDLKPEGHIYNLDENSIEWHFTNIEPTSDDNIDIGYYRMEGSIRGCMGGDEDEYDSLASSYLPSDSDDYNDPNMIYLQYYPCKAFDSEKMSAWVEGVDGPGIVEWIDIGRYYGYLEAKHNKIKIYNGLQTDYETWQENNRVKTLKITFDDGKTQILDLYNSYGYQILDLAQSFGIDVETSVKLEILDVYPGTKYDDTAISEIRLLPELKGDVYNTGKTFPDTVGHFYHEAISHLKENGIVDGYDDGLFRADNFINRAELTKIIVEAVYPGQATGSDCFDDVHDEWFAKYVCFAKDNDIVVGYNDGTFRPAQNVTYPEGLKIVLETSGFSLISPTDPWYQGYIDMADGMYANLAESEQAEPFTRGKMAQLVRNFYQRGE